MARSFTGADATDVITGTMVPYVSGAWSMGCWFYHLTAPSGNRMLLSVSGSGVNVLTLYIPDTFADQLRLDHQFSGGAMAVRVDPNIPTLAWQCAIAHGTGSFTDTNNGIYWGNQSTVMTNMTFAASSSASGTSNTGGNVHIGRDRGIGGWSINSRIAQCFFVPWRMTVDEAERFRQGDWTVLYAHGTPRFFVPLMGASLYDLSGSF